MATDPPASPSTGSPNTKPKTYSRPTRSQPSTKTSQPSSLQHSPLTPPARVEKKQQEKKKPLRQIHFKTSNTRITCPSCNMSYVPYLKPDKDSHHRFHEKSLKGREWSPNWGRELYQVRLPIEGKNQMVSMVEVNSLGKLELAATKELLELVNTELQAPDDTGLWLKGPQFGKCFVCVWSKRAIGIICLERVEKGGWMIQETGKVVPNQSVPLVAGISRVYVLRNFRRCHVASELLQCTRKHFVYGIELKKTEIGWSQPSEFGSKLALNFNSQKHKSGYHLVPVYVE